MAHQGDETRDAISRDRRDATVRVRLIAGAAAAMAVVFAGGACGNGAAGVSACRQIEGARCRQAPACSITLEPPYHSSGNDVDACIRFYDVACLHGLTVADPGAYAVNACLAAIESGDCALVITPETGPCAWLAPPGPVTTDASETAADVEQDSSDAAQDSPDSE
jgi:hypothetical protein